MSFEYPDSGTWTIEEIPAHWQWAPFSLLFEDLTSSEKKLKQAQYLKQGEYPVIDQGQQLVGGYTNEKALLYREPLPVIVFGDHTRCIKYIDTPFVQGADGVKVLSPTQAIDPRYGYWALTAIQLPDKGYSRHVKFLKSSIFPLAPLNEQRRIVAKLEELFARADACRKRLEQVPRLLKQFRQSVLAAACSGEVTANWRGQEGRSQTALALIEYVVCERQRRYEQECKSTAELGKRKPSRYDNLDPKVRTYQDTFTIPETWRWVNLRFLMDESEPFCYGVVQPGDNDPVGVRLIRVCDLSEGTVALENLRGISSAIHRQYQRSTLKGGEILVSLVGTIGRAAVVPYECNGFNIARALAKVPIKDFNSKYIVYWLSTSIAKWWMVRDAREVARLTLNLEQLKTLPVPLPPLEEQAEIVRRVEALFKIADAVEAHYKKAQEQLAKLPQAILAKAFRGELVPQDPTDEPAAVLLERIRAEKAGGEKAPGKTKPQRKAGRQPAAALPFAKSTNSQ